MAQETEKHRDSGQADRLADENALLRASMAEMRERMSELEELSDTDARTGLAGRGRLVAALERAIGNADRHKVPAALLHIDLSGLAQVNRDHGRVAGDAALKHVAALLTGLIRSTDMLARIGGDAFALLLDHLDHNSAIETAERLARCIARSPLDIGGADIDVAVAIGTATILPGDQAAEVLARAEANMHRAKAEV